LEGKKSAVHCSYVFLENVWWSTLHIGYVIERKIESVEVLPQLVNAEIVMSNVVIWV